MSPGVEVAQIGPFARGARLAGGWQIERLVASEHVALVHLRREGDVVVLALPGRAGPPDPGPFAPGVDLTYRATELAFDAFAEAGRELAARVAAACVGDPRATTDAWLAHAREAHFEAEPSPERAPRGLPVSSAGDWEARARSLVGGSETLALRELLGADALPERRCVLPWVQLELGMHQQYGPCCSDFQAQRARSDAAPLALFQSDVMQAFRAALAGPDHPATCRTSCPKLAGRSEAIDTFVFHGGPAAFVENQIRIARALLDGGEPLDATPLSITFPTTSYCNYDCLMCRFGEEGTLEDELPPAFYEALEPLLPGLHHLTALGGEPLASPVFRRFLAGPALRAHPQVRVSLTTNGSYLTAGELQRLAHVRFASITVSLNAASPETYLAVNRGLRWERIRENLDALRAHRRDTGRVDALVYSMVVLKRNAHELTAFAELARADGADVRFMLPMYDRHGQSILTCRETMERVERELRELARKAWGAGRVDASRRILGEANVLSDRLARGILRPLPDDDGAPPVPLRRRG